MRILSIGFVLFSLLALSGCGTLPQLSAVNDLIWNDSLAGHGVKIPPQLLLRLNSRDEPVDTRLPRISLTAVHLPFSCDGSGGSTYLASEVRLAVKNPAWPERIQLENTVFALKSKVALSFRLARWGYDQIEKKAVVSLATADGRDAGLAVEFVGISLSNARSSCVPDLSGRGNLSAAESAVVLQNLLERSPVIAHLAPGFEVSPAPAEFEAKAVEEALTFRFRTRQDLPGLRLPGQSVTLCRDTMITYRGQPSVDDVVTDPAQKYRIAPSDWAEVLLNDNFRGQLEAQILNQDGSLANFAFLQDFDAAGGTLRATKMRSVARLDEFRRARRTLLDSCAAFATN